MTREEMIYEIDKELIQRTFSEKHVDLNGAWDSATVAEFILDRIEKLGMLPPLRTETVEERFKDSYYYPVRCVNSWEKE